MRTAMLVFWDKGHHVASYKDLEGRLDGAKAEGDLPENADCASLASCSQDAFAAPRLELHPGNDQADIATLTEGLAPDVETLRPRTPDCPAH